MAADLAQRPFETFDAEFRIRTLRTGLWSTAFALAYMSAYLGMTWDQSNRAVLAGLLAAGIAVTLAIALIPVERLIRGPRREAFLISWSLGLIALIAIAASFDGGAASPITLLLFVAPVYAALAYPLRATLIVSSVNLLTYISLAVFAGGLPVEAALVFTGVLLNVTWVCAWQSRGYEGQRLQLERVSRSDPLTGVLNRLGFEERLAAEIARCRRDECELTLAIVDLDRFKAINDSQGHMAGDRVLCTVAAVLRAGVRDGDVVGRLGGDEFGVILLGGAARNAVERIVQTLESVAPATAGTAIYPADGEDELRLHQAADADLYANKRRGHPPEAVFGDELNGGRARQVSVD